MSPLQKTLLIAIAIPSAMALGLTIKSHVMPSPEVSTNYTATTNTAHQQLPSMLNPTVTATATAPKATRTTGYATVEAFDPNQPDTYQIAVANYSNQRIQFNNCAVTDPLLGETFKSGSQIMIEGSSPDPQFVYINNERIALNGYSFAFIRLPVVKQVRTFKVHCETSDAMQYNVTTLTVYP